MNFYQRMWGERGYGRRWLKVQATHASESRKLATLARVWARMTA